MLNVLSLYAFFKLLNWVPDQVGNEDFSGSGIFDSMETSKSICTVAPAKAGAQCFKGLIHNRLNRFNRLKKIPFSKRWIPAFADMTERCAELSVFFRLVVKDSILPDESQAGFEGCRMGSHWVYKAIHWKSIYPKKSMSLLGYFKIRIKK